MAGAATATAHRARTRSVPSEMTREEKRVPSCSIWMSSVLRLASRSMCRSWIDGMIPLSDRATAAKRFRVAVAEAIQERREVLAEDADVVHLARGHGLSHRLADTSM